MPQMVVQEPVCPTCSAHPKFAKAIGIGSTAVETHDLVGITILENQDFRKALELSLENNGLLSSKGVAAPYTLDVQLIEFDHPTSGGWDVYARPIIRYVIRERATGDGVFDEVITTNAIVTRADTCCFDAQLKMAIERSTKANISEFIQHLVTGFKPFQIDTGTSDGKGVTDEAE